MIGHAADFERSHLVFARNATEIRPEPFAQFRCDYWTSISGREYAMKICADVGHAGIQPSLRD